MKTSLYFILLVLALGADAGAAERQIYFSGVGIVPATKLQVGNANAHVTCGIAITNTGTASVAVAPDQRLVANSFGAVSVTGVAAPTSTITSTPDAISFTLMNPGSNLIRTTADDTACSGNVISSGGTCLIRWMNFSVSNVESVGICSGRFRIMDESSNTPGSVTASGSLFLWQEASVMGGVLSGAHYFSGVPLRDNSGGTPGGIQLGVSGVDIEAARQLGFSGVTPRAGQMNIYCSSACRQYNPAGANKTRRCNEICGYGGQVDGTTVITPKDFPYPSQTMGWLISSPPFKFGVPGNLLTPIPAHTSPRAGNPSFTWNVANGHFAGGFVTEMVYGPLSSICSANPEYWASGEIDFTYPPYVSFTAPNQRGVVVPGNTAYTLPAPQRLLCSQRHSRDDLFFRSGSSISFPVNAGLPF